MTVSVSSSVPPEASAIQATPTSFVSVTEKFPSALTLKYST